MSVIPPGFILSPNGIYMILHHKPLTECWTGQNPAWSAETCHKGFFCVDMVLRIFKIFTLVIFSTDIKNNFETPRNAEILGTLAFFRQRSNSVCVCGGVIERECKPTLSFWNHPCVCIYEAFPMICVKWQNYNIILGVAIWANSSDACEDHCVPPQECPNLISLTWASC